MGAKNSEKGGQWELNILKRGSMGAEVEIRKYSQ
jgi:hypothetical protein